MMLTPWNIYCEGARLRSVLKHSWLENEIEQVTPERAVQRCSRPGGWLKLEGEFPARLECTRQLASRLAEMFGPGQLIDQCPAFAGLTEDARRQLRETVHQAYLESSAIEEFRKPLTRAADQLESALRAFAVACEERALAAPDEAMDAWKGALRAAAELKNLLDFLPEGLVFP
jgi:hypothetical protein